MPDRPFHSFGAPKSTPRRFLKDSKFADVLIFRLLHFEKAHRVMDNNVVFATLSPFRVSKNVDHAPQNRTQFHNSKMPLTSILLKYSSIEAFLWQQNCERFGRVTDLNGSSEYLLLLIIHHTWLLIKKKKLKGVWNLIYGNFSFFLRMPFMIWLISWEGLWSHTRRAL